MILLAASASLLSVMVSDPVFAPVMVPAAFYSRS